ncbi:MAG: SHOCT domain-containing protein [Acidimicrobiia bacterium]
MTTLATTLATTGWHDGRAWEGPPWPAFFFVPLLLMTAVAVTLYLTRSRRRPGVTIVAERYARGEIDEAEYQRRVAALRGR